MKRSLCSRLLLSWMLALGLAVNAALAENSVPEGPVPETPPVLLQMIRDDAVHRDLGLSESQREQILSVLEEVDGAWFRSRTLPAPQHQQAVTELTGKVDGKLPEILTPQQLSRVKQLVRQALGTRMVLRDDVVAELGLSPAAVDAFRTAFLETDEAVRATQQKLQAGELTAQVANEQVSRLKDKERQVLVDTLNSQQKSKIGKLTGEAFDFSQVRRTYPLAPEFAGDGVSWIQGGPLKLSQLKGKVVAVHFYAFQCINCQRNLPHYQAWHRDFADRDLVIIGIQTPETSAERDLDRVTAAVKLEGIEYPVMMDAQAANWKTWSNTMWPTVYLVDKQGFIRRWWQGELNWQGTPGEQQMRETIEQLLAEDF